MEKLIGSRKRGACAYDLLSSRLPCTSVFARLVGYGMVVHLRRTSALNFAGSFRFLLPTQRLRSMQHPTRFYHASLLNAVRVAAVPVDLGTSAGGWVEQSRYPSAFRKTPAPCDVPCQHRFR